MCLEWEAECQHFFNESTDSTDVFQDYVNLLKFLVSSGCLPAHVGDAWWAHHVNNRLFTYFKTVSACYSVLCQLRSVRRSLSRSVLQSLVSSLVLTRQCHPRWHSIIPSSVASDGREFSRAACVFFVEVRPRHSAPSATALVESPRADSVQVAVLVYKCLHGTAPSYLANELQCLADSEARRWLRSTSHHRWLSVIHGCPPSVIRPFLLPLAILGTVCLNTSRPHPLCLFSEDAWRLSCSVVPFLELVTTTFVVAAQWLSSFSDT